VHPTVLKENAKILAKILPYTLHEGVPTSYERPMFLFRTTLLLVKLYFCIYIWTNLTGHCAFFKNIKNWKHKKS